MPSSASRGAPPEPAPLGSLTQSPGWPRDSCPACGSEQLTRITLTLADGSPVVFTSCQACEHRTWTQDGTPLSVARVLDKTRTARVPRPARRH